MQSKVDVVIVSWNSGQDLNDCLRSLEASDCDGYEIASVIVVDNASQAARAPSLAGSNLRLPVRIVRNERNRGFAAACNQGAQIGGSDYILFLNPDVELAPSALGQALRPLVDDQQSLIGAVGVGLTDANGGLLRSCSPFPRPVDMLGRCMFLDRLFPNLIRPHFLPLDQHRATGYVDQIMGAFWLMRRDDFNLASGWDERFFMYMEDVDFACRIAGRGQKCLYLHSPRAIHAGGRSSGQVKDARLFYALRSRVLYGRKHYGFWGRSATTLACLVVGPAVQMAGLGLMGRFADVAICLRALRALWRAYPFRTAEQCGEATWAKPVQWPDT